VQILKTEGLLWLRRVGLYGEPGVTHTDGIDCRVFGQSNSFVATTTRPNNVPLQRESVTELRPCFSPFYSPGSLHQLDDPNEPFVKALYLRLQAAHVRFNQSSVLVK
jgi:hypothetical protein